ncbi:glycosyltransferase 87 family protein [Actinoplanes sp. CA-015351]|uniref:glycosyltransferase 87 family protein n=1 Tax=Actinoplanes sp. CA-015351 TaxID=3239897 RepID=UPI003D99FA1E
MDGDRAPAGSRVAPELLLTAALIAVAVAVRFLGFGLETIDYDWYLGPWSRFIAAHGGFAALAHPFSDYNVAYLYLLTGFTWLSQHTPLPVLFWIKLGSALFDGVLAVYAARIVALRGPGWRMPLLAGLSVLLLPTVVLNGSYWGQCDTIYSAFAVAGLYHLLRGRQWAGTALIAVAFAFKVQTIFLFPALAALLLTRRLRWRCMITIPVIYVLFAVPAWLTGRPFGDLMLIYVGQTDRFPALTLNAPNIYAFLRPAESHLDMVRTAGILFAIAAILGLIFLIVAREVVLDTEHIVVLAAASALLAPFLLPGMHERYFMLAEVLTVVAAFWVPRRLWFVPVLVQAASIITYETYLVQAKPAPVDLRILTLLVFTALATTIGYLFRVRKPARLAPTPVGNTIAG